MSDSLVSRKEHGHHAPLRCGFNKDFNDLLNGFFGNWLDLPEEKNFIAKNEPKIEVRENEKEVTVRAEMPGMKEEDIDLELSSDGYLTISGEKKQEHREEHKGSYFSEISYGTFSRTVPLPWELKFDDAKADFENVVLTVTVPKSSDEQGKKRKIAINRK